MRSYCVENEKVKREYFTFLVQAKRQDESTVDAVAKAISRYEQNTNYKNFNTFNTRQAVAFKRHLSKQQSEKTGQPLSKATVSSTLRQLKSFFQWLAMQSGYKSRINFTDTEYLNMSDKELRIASARRKKPIPTLEQIRHVVASMPTSSDVELRNRALVAFTILTGARDSAIASLKLKHIDLASQCVTQDAREVNTKFSKTFCTYFFPVGDELVQVMHEWVKYLRSELLWGNDDPLFPKTEVISGRNKKFVAIGLMREHWSTAASIREIFRKAFEAAGLPYSNPHSFRNTLALYGEQQCTTAEEFKAWSQNLGHESVLTTFYSYGEVQTHRQGEIMQKLGTEKESQSEVSEEFLNAVMRKLMLKAG